MVSEFDFCGRRCNFWQSQIFAKLPFSMYFKNHRVGQKGVSSTKILFSDHFTIEFLPHYYYKVVLDFPKNHQKFFFCFCFFVFYNFPIKFPIVTFKTYQHRKRGKRDSFRNVMATVIKWEGVEVATGQRGNQESHYHTTPYPNLP